MIPCESPANRVDLFHCRSKEQYSESAADRRSFFPGLGRSVDSYPAHSSLAIIYGLPEERNTRLGVRIALATEYGLA